MRKLSTAKRKEIKNDPFYNQCALKEFKDHVCGGRVTIEHAIIVAGRQYDEKWSLVPICAKFHGVDRFQDNGELKKDMTVWVALNRATDLELFTISKAINYIRERDRLNKKYGKYKAPEVKPVLAINY